MLRPLNDSVVVEPIKTPDLSRGGVVLPDDAKQSYHGLRALVVAVGPGAMTFSGVRLPIDLREGDVVILRHQGPLIREGGKLYSVVSEREILAVVGDSQEVRTFSMAESNAVPADC